VEKPSRDAAPQAPKILPLSNAEVSSFVTRFLHRGESFLETARSCGSPLYAFDRSALHNRILDFQRAFARVMANVDTYYAIKSNNHPAIVADVVGAGLGLDVSSGTELAMALTSKAERIVFSGPGKTAEELQAAVAHSARVIVHLDSFGELERLERVAAQAGQRVRVGIRLCTGEHGIWRKFGISPDDLGRFLARAETCEHVDVCGLQFHLSWNTDPSRYEQFIARLGKILRSLAAPERSRLSFIDVGGGYWPPDGEWLQFAATPEGRTGDHEDTPAADYRRRFKQEASSIDEFARSIAEALQTHIPADMKYRVFVEPGRWICHEAMHILVTVVDRKNDDLVIVDGGINAVGWERYESDYFPVINLTRPGLTEQPCLVAGSLCTPHDIWGYSYFGEGIEVGDVLLVPNQGAYTYSLRQHFIKPPPEVVVLRDT